jgi:glutamyl-tRNA synthetase
LETSDFKILGAAFDEINHHLTLRTFLVGYKLSLADFVVWGALKSMYIFFLFLIFFKKKIKLQFLIQIFIDSAAFNRQIKTGNEVGGPHLMRWFNYINSLDFIQQGTNWVAQNAKSPVCIK